MRTKKVFDFIQDPGHGWLKVPYALVREYGIANKVSSYSYARKLDVYLEEDMDMGFFLEAYKAKHGTMPAFREKVSRHRPSKIRSYDHYTSPEAL
jgi:hypothetical protein